MFSLRRLKPQTGKKAGRPNYGKQKSRKKFLFELRALERRRENTQQA